MRPQEHPIIEFCAWNFLGSYIEKVLAKHNAAIYPITSSIRTDKKTGALTMLTPEQHAKEELPFFKNKHAIAADHIFSIQTVAIEPKTLEVAMNDDKAKVLATRFTDAFIVFPDLAPKIFQTVREKWNDPSPQNSEKIRKFIATTPWAYLKPNKPTLISNMQHKERAQVIGKVSPANVRDALGERQLPKQRHLYTTKELGDAFYYLRSLGYCRYQ